MTMKKTLSDIISRLEGYDPKALPVEQALVFIRELVAPVTGIEQVSIRPALGRILARDLISPIDVPAHDNSAMDGYAFDGAQLGAAVLALKSVGTAWAGKPFDQRVGPGYCVRIMTGAVMPAGCDTVVPQELCQVHDDRVTIPADAGLHAGDNRRLCGEDIARSSAALKAGRTLRPADLGLIASLGIAEVSVRRRVRVAFFSTGDEVRSIGDTLEAGQLYDSNRYTLYGMLARLGIDLIDMGVVRDDPHALEEAFRRAAENADAIITSGGVSVGEADYTKQIMAKLGDVAFWTIAMRPGRPMAFGQIQSGVRSAYLFGLPGNPVAVMVTFYHFVRAGLLRLGGSQDAPLPLMRAISLDAVRKKPGRTEYQRAILQRSSDGHTTVRLTGQQGSGVLRSMSEANCFVVLHHAQGSVAAGDAVDVMLFEGLA